LNTRFSYNPSTFRTF